MAKIFFMASCFILLAIVLNVLSGHLDKPHLRRIGFFSAGIGCIFIISAFLCISTCPSCGAETDTKYCTYCGADTESGEEINWTCSICNETVHKPYCGTCGTKY